MNIKELREEIKAGYDSVDAMSELLAKHGSDEDPIIYKGEDTTPRDLANYLNPSTSALDLKISFWGTLPDGTFGKRSNSNFAHMLLDRINLYEERRKEADRKAKSRKRQIEYKVSWREWCGVESCGSTEWDYKSEKFKTKAEAEHQFSKMKVRHHHAKLQKTTIELLGESND
tara:strand:- start:856 stop:1371 length:516 start_codon:yes stop_codon:yes gene_type:complete